ncbi:MAG TPA: YetF domain-containing protein [Telluria sp.]|nr:YetF domain-containing protein [Telluria sp.]
MFEMSLPWWEFIVRAGAVYGVLLVMVRISGHRTIGQFTPFDLLVVLLLSETVSNALTGGDESLVGGLIGAATVMALNVVIAILTSRSALMTRIFDGHPVLIGRNGEFFPEVMKTCRLADADIEEALRESNCQRADMDYAFLEIDGKITILTKKK